MHCLCMGMSVKAFFLSQNYKQFYDEERNEEKVITTEEMPDANVFEVGIPIIFRKENIYLNLSLFFNKINFAGIIFSLILSFLLFYSPYHEKIHFVRNRYF